MTISKDSHRGNYIRAINVAGAVFSGTDATAADLAAFAAELTDEQNTYFVDNGLDDTGGGSGNARSGGRRSSGRSSSSKRSSGRSSSRGSSGGKGKGKGLTDKQANFIQDMVDEVTEAGEDPVHDVDSIEAIYDFGERQEAINELIEQRDDVRDQ